MTDPTERPPRQPDLMMPGPSLPASDRLVVELIGPDAIVALARPLLATHRLLIASDFDGTLAELSMDPWGPRIVPASQRALRRLAGDPRIHVAFISGRTVTDLAARVRVGGATYLGDHGAERARARRGLRVANLRTHREPSGEAEKDLVAILARSVPVAIGQPWLVVEDKVTSITFHFRAAPDIDAARTRLRSVIDTVDPDHLLERSGSRLAIELRPAGASTKGQAMRALLEELQPSAVLMLGDDRNDALAFDVVRDARSAGEIEGLAVAVAGHPDVTAAVAPRADAVIDGPRQVARLLHGLAAAVERTV